MVNNENHVVKIDLFMNHANYVISSCYMPTEAAENLNGKNPLTSYLDNCTPRTTNSLEYSYKID